MTASRLVAALLAASGIAYGAYALAFGSGYTLRVLAMAGILAIAALGYQLIFGHGGALALSQGTFMGVGGYVAAILATRYGVPSDATLPAAAVTCAIVAAAVGLLVLRLQTHYFALATLVIGQLAFLLAISWESVTGGANGIAGIPGLSGLGTPIRNGIPTVALVWTIAALGGVVLWAATRGRLGQRFALARAHPDAARCSGIDTARLRLLAFVASAGYAGVAGALQVHTIRVVSPDLLGFPLMVTLLTIGVVGGRTRVAGAVAGALLVVSVPEWFRILPEAYLLAYGGMLLLAIVAMPDGLVGAAERLARRCGLPADRPRLVAIPASLPSRRARPGRGAPLLELRGVTRRFGGVRALKDVSLTVNAGEVVGLIGPNGSGKTTLANVVTGLFQAQSGVVMLGGHDISRLLPHAIARAGVARTFQSPALVGELTALDNAALGVRGGSSTPTAVAAGCLAALGIAEQAGELCDRLPEAVRRRVEIARALACDPRLVLLDEPAAGLDVAERAVLAAGLAAIARDGVALLVIEHDVAFLASICDRLVCLDAGRVIANGPPAAVQADARVRAAYLGGAAP